MLNNLKNISPVILLVAICILMLNMISNRVEQINNIDNKITTTERR